MIHRFSCIKVRTHHCKFHGIFCVGLTVKNIQLPGQFIISEFPAVYISCGDPVPDACKSFILAVLFVIGITNSNANESDITIAEQQTVFTTATKFEVFQVLGDGALANCEEKGYSTSFFTGPVVYIVTDGQNLFYDDQVIEVPKGKKAMQIGTFRYETKLGEKVVPVIKFQ